MSLVADAGSVLAAVGLLGLLMPVPRLNATARRGAGLALTIAGWLLLVSTLLPDAVSDRLRTPLGALALVVGVAVALAVGLLVGALLARRPTIWFVLLALALPIRLPVTLGGEQARLLIPLYAVIALGILAWLVSRVRGTVGADDDPSTPLDPAIGVFAAFVLVSSLWSADAEQAAIQAVFFYVPFVLLYLTVVAWWPRARALAALATTTIVVAVPVAALALVQYATRDIFWNSTLQQANVYSAFFRVNAIFFDPNILGRFLVIAILAAVAIAWRARDARLVIALWVVAAFLSAGLVPTFSRSSALMLLVGLALITWRGLGARRTLLAGAIVVVVMGGLAFATSESVRDATTSVDRLESVSEGRFGLVRGGLRIWRDDPIVGVGLGGFEPRFERTLTPTEQRRVRVVVSHNTPITVLSEQGIVGLALFGVLVVWAGLVLTRGALRDADDDGWAIWSMQAMLAGIVVHSLLYAALFEDPYTWVLLGGATALSVAVARRGSETAPSLSDPTIPIGA